MLMMPALPQIPISSLKHKTAWVQVHMKEGCEKPSQTWFIVWAICSVFSDKLGSIIHPHVYWYRLCLDKFTFKCRIT